MAKKSKKKNVKKTGPEKGLMYFTTRVLERAVTKGTKSEAKKAITLVGYTVREDHGWVVKEFKDGSIERISQIEEISSDNFILD